MFIINCPYCGEREQSEFKAGGEAHIIRPKQPSELSDDQWEVAYQSRLGPGWLTPFTDKRLAELPEEGKKNIAVLCPSFISDCLETLEEIDIRGRKTFFDAGGKNMTYIPCLNDSEDTINLLENLVKSA
jgi:ferrochelatase